MAKMAAVDHIIPEHYDQALGFMIYPPITDRQLDVLKAIHQYAVTNRMYPTQREIAKLLGVAQQTVSQNIDALVSKKYLLRPPESRRNIRLSALAVTKIQGEQLLLVEQK
jgi:DNA-binding MarR family transcriptional regulator